LQERSANFEDLLWNRVGDHFELAIEAMIPKDLCKQLEKHNTFFDTVRYEVSIGRREATDEIQILAESVFLQKQVQPRSLQNHFSFPSPPEPPSSILRMKKRTAQAHKTQKLVINKTAHKNDNYYSELYSEKGKGWCPSFHFGSRKSALRNMPDDETKMPVTTWLRSLLANGVQKFVLDSQKMRQASPPGQTKHFITDGSNLPWILDHFQKKYPERYQLWINHVQTALPDIIDINTVELEYNRHRYLQLVYRNELKVPSWMASDGTLRLLALTLPAYLPEFKGIFLIEEPENGIHPCAVETIYQSLSSVYQAQILVATHSPVVLHLVEPDQLLCFAKDENGATDIVLGTHHPALQGWRNDIGLGTLLASGVLG